MASNTQKTKRKRSGKKKPHKANLKADAKRTDKVRETLRSLAAKDRG